LETLGHRQLGAIKVQANEFGRALEIESGFLQASGGLDDVDGPSEIVGDASLISAFVNVAPMPSD
jgi:hypothetical protein